MLIYFRYLHYKELGDACEVPILASTFFIKWATMEQTLTSGCGSTLNMSALRSNY